MVSHIKNIFTPSWQPQKCFVSVNLKHHQSNLFSVPEVKKINTEFLLGFIATMEGEKDPRNLLLLFSFFPLVTKHLSLDNFAEDLFEVVAAYFPIDFIPVSGCYQGSSS